ncbi:MAG: hypothetical protein ACLSHC_00140 [Bilophila wadsworthia]
MQLAFLGPFFDRRHACGQRADVLKPLPPSCMAIRPRMALIIGPAEVFSVKSADLTSEIARHVAAFRDPILAAPSTGTPLASSRCLALRASAPPVRRHA